MAAPPKVSKELLDMLNDAIARELSVSISYMWQHVLMTGVQGFAVKDEIKKIAIVEMKHAEEIAERLVYLGGKPTSKPTEIRVGETLKEMMQINTELESGAIELYRKVIAKAEEEGDIVTADLFHEILAQEEEHHDTFTGLLE
ncbi:ferritin [Oceanidesulfovibrio indonesiensis]|uniref:Bacterioferritin n=1 Tax=Oceanidesulfovibrio indonesiensis TaxID=54767 RepID=A0A7M3MEW2_9BACT|nr:ferritin-like domain-containing protein [Oceanidesulfovibrio indonesiensis]TVM17561.1 ferritin [Oceanidesulfovibrio indonesiensis]